MAVKGLITKNRNKIACSWPENLNGVPLGLEFKRTNSSCVCYFVMFDRLFLTSMSAYRGGYNVIDYGMSGAVVGSIVRFRLGPPAMAVGGVLGKS